MELWQLRTFRVVAETLNFTQAAKQLNLTQSAVSHQIKALETDLGEPLFIRAKRGVRLSESGKLVLEHAERILDEAQTLRERVSGHEHSASGSVRVAAATQALDGDRQGGRPALARPAGQASRGLIEAHNGA